MAVTCPTLFNILASEECTENFAGLGATVYVGIKDELSSALTANDNTYSTPAFASGKGLYKFSCKEDSQQIQGSSLGRRKGFEITANFVLEAVNATSAKCARALNNLDIFIIMEDGEDSQILYDPSRKVTFDSGGIASDTGAAASDDRTVTLAAKLSPVKYPNLYVTAPVSGGWDSLLAEE